VRPGVRNSNGGRGTERPRSPDRLFNFLDYRCPIEAIRRVWVLSGGAVSWNPQSATGIEPVMRGRALVRSHIWFRVPLVRPALLLEVDAEGPADICYTPLRNPDQVRTALTEALQRAGRMIHVDGRVNVGGSADG
jgi:hypothetical protein